MRHFKDRGPVMLVLALLIWLPSAGAIAQETPMTVAEATNYTTTSRFADVMDFVHKLQRLSPFIRVEVLCTSAEGREVPLLVLGKPVPLSPLDLKADPRIVVYIQANIHAGEVEGKESSLMLARDILLDKEAPYFDKLIILIAPVFNADGNEKISLRNRSYQPGPENGVGVRPNGQNLDLNRDAMKLESPELCGLVRRVLNRWDPLLLVDCHTTDGAFHEEVVTWSWPINPNGDKPILEFERQIMLPAINRILKEKYNTPGLPYGEFADDHAPEKGWQVNEPQPRYITNYIGLRNRLSILDENYVHADFKTRVLGNYYFLKAILDYAAANSAHLAQLAAEADQRALRRDPASEKPDMFGVEFVLKPLKEPVTIHGFETEVIDRPGTYPELKKTDRKKTFVVPYFAEYEVLRSVPIPFAYLVPAQERQAAAKLLQHGIVVEKLSESATLEVQTFLPKEIKGTEKLFQGHRLNSARGEYITERQEFPLGTFVVRTAQILGRLAACLLEPESDDGLLAWNFFDRNLVAQWERGYRPYPVRKLLKETSLVTEAVREDRGD